MRRMSQRGLVVCAVLMSGCFHSDPMYLGRNRPAVDVAPTNAQEEMRDARYFLAYPDEGIGPRTEFGARGAQYN